MKELFFLLALCLCSLATWAQDFTATAPTGQTLFFHITSSSDHIVEVSGLSATSSIPELEIPNSVLHDGYGYVVESIGSLAFHNCSALTSVTSITITDSVRTVGERAFSGCTGLRMVSIGESVTQIGDNSFEGCTNVDTLYYNAINLESTYMWYVNDYGFRPMQLDTLVIGNKVQTLPEDVFEDGFFVRSGSSSEHTGHAHVNPFRSYFTYSGQTPPQTLSVGFGGGDIGIDEPMAPTPQNTSIRYSNDVYDLMGRKIRTNAETLDGLPQGIYIWQGKKVLHSK